MENRDTVRELFMVNDFIQGKVESALRQFRIRVSLMERR